MKYHSLPAVAKIKDLEHEVWALMTQNHNPF